MGVKNMKSEQEIRKRINIVSKVMKDHEKYGNNETRYTSLNMLVWEQTILEWVLNLD